MKVRVTYDWERIEVPTSIVNMTDRPNDGGGVIEVSWLPAEDALGMVTESSYGMLRVERTGIQAKTS